MRFAKKISILKVAWPNPKIKEANEGLYLSRKSDNRVGNRSSRHSQISTFCLSHWQKITRLFLEIDFVFVETVVEDEI